MDSTQTQAPSIGRRILRRGRRNLRDVRSKLRIRTRVTGIAREIVIWSRSLGPKPEIVVKQGAGSTAVDEYWNRHTVLLLRGRFMSAKESETYVRKRNAKYPLFPELMDVYGDHAGETLLDYGCGPGDDTTGFLLWSNASKVIGIDVSQKALGLLSHRLGLHGVDPKRVELMRITDSTGTIPLPDASVDWLHCGGVLHHTTHPTEILKEFHRVMKPRAQGRLMLYNRDSVMYHVWIAYVRMIVGQEFPGLTVDQAFTKSTDGPECPVSDAWAPQRVLDAIAAAGLGATFRGGYIHEQEPDWLRDYADRAKADDRLGEEHRSFISEIVIDERGYPTFHGKYAGIGGVYTITKPGAASK